MFVNCSNHPSVQWGKKQKEAALVWGEIVDYPFPQVSAQESESEIRKMADRMVAEILRLHPDAVMCQGEFTLSYAVTKGLLEEGVKVVAACSERMTQENIAQDGTVEKTAAFRFVRFREYRR